MSGKDPSRLTRRGLLKGAAAGSVVTACRTAPRGDSGGTGTTSPGSIDHIIMVMMENRSFDHWYGARKLLEGNAAEDGLDAGMSNPGPDGSDVPVFHATQLCPNDPPHGWSSSHDQFDEGRNDGFAQEHGSRYGTDGAEVMGYLSRDDLPISYALADAYAVCDRYFCSVMGPTWPNRLYGHLGSSQGMKSNDLPDTGSYTDPAVWAKLTEAGVDWRYYYTDLPFIALLGNQIEPGRSFVFDQFLQDARTGDLPPVCWVDPGFSYNDNHPPHHPALGELFIAAVHEALATSPAWDRCLIVLTYDEHGGFFDHVPPPTTADDRAADGFDQLGFRVPSVLIGPYVRQGVDSTQYEHTSWLRWICDKHGIEPWNARIAAADPFSGAIDTDRLATGDPRPAVELPGFSFDESLLGPECSYFDQRDYQYLEPLHQRALSLGMESLLHDRARLAATFRRIWQRRGLIG